MEHANLRKFVSKPENVEQTSAVLAEHFGTFKLEPVNEGLPKVISPGTLLIHRALSFECRSINRFVNRTKPNICVHSETMLPITCPHLASESIEA